MRWLLLFLVFQLTVQNHECFSKNFQIKEDLQITEKLKQIQKTFLLSRQNSKFNRLDFTILLPTNNSKIWKRASVGVNCLDHHGNKKNQKI